MPEKCLVNPCGDSTVLMSLDLVRRFGKQHPAPDPGDPSVSPFRHVPFQITLKSKTKRGKCIPTVFGIHAWNHKNNTSSGTPFSIVISNMWGNSNEKHCAEEKPKRFVSSMAPFLPFYRPLMSDFDVDKMIGKQSSAARFNSSGEWVSGTSGMSGRDGGNEGGNAIS